MIAIDRMRVCVRCKERKVLTEFGMFEGSLGLKTDLYCKSCREKTEQAKAAATVRRKIKEEKREALIATYPKKNTPPTQGELHLVQYNAEFKRRTDIYERLTEKTYKLSIEETETLTRQLNASLRKLELLYNEIPKYLRKKLEN